MTDETTIIICHRHGWFGGENGELWHHEGDPQERTLLYVLITIIQDLESSEHGQSTLVVE